MGNRGHPLDQPREMTKIEDTHNESIEDTHGNPGEIEDTH